MSELLKFLKKDAVVKIEISSSFSYRIQQLLFFILRDIPKEKLEEYKTIIEEKQQPADDIVEHIITISALLKEIEDKADEQGLTYEADPTQQES